MSKQRRIVCAANLYPDGIIVCSARHYDMIMHTVLCSIYDDRPSFSEVKQGFIDNIGVWHDRKAAYKIALAADQIRHKTGNLHDETLYSEDLY